MNKAILFLCCIVLVACGKKDYSLPDSVSRSANAKTFVYECADEYRFIARTENSTAWLFLRRSSHKLEKIPSASGVKYSDGKNIYWSKGEEAMLSLDGVEHKGCKNNRRKAIWEHAKLNGVDFRAVGNEPGWTLEISNKADIVLITDYGQKHYRFDAGSITSEAQLLTTVYEAQSNGNRIEILLTGKRCTDTMSNDTFPVSVSIQLNEKSYRGCGKALH